MNEDFASAPGLKCLALLASYNRKATTLRCLETLSRAARYAAIELFVTLYDDSSSDGTADAVKNAFPDTTVIHGNGTAYWVGGMRSALTASEDIIDEVDYILLLNDDTELYADALVNLATVDPTTPAIVVGTVVDPISGERTYGGWRGISKITALRMSPVEQEPAALVDSFNCNAVLLTVPALRMLGGFDHRFTHKMADIDMGLRARRLGIPMRLGRREVGECEKNIGYIRSLDQTLSIRERLRAVVGPKESPPSEWFLFTFRHGRILAPALFVSPYLRALGLRSFSKTSSKRLSRDRLVPEVDD